MSIQTGKWQEKLKDLFGNNVDLGEQVLSELSRDASIFEVMPSAVVKPQDAEDLKNLVKFVSDKKSGNPELSLTARAAGTDMTGGPLNDSIIVDFGNFNKIGEINHSTGSGHGYAIAEPGVYYRDFEKATLASGLLLPSYPASRELCMVGGMVSNNAGGEKSLKYGKTENYVEELSVILNDGNEYLLKALTIGELEQKKSQTDFEGDLYKKMYDLLETNYEIIKNAKPNVSKNSAGYALWDVWPARHIFDLTKLFVGSQGTLGFITKIKFKLIKPQKFSKLLVMFLNDIKPLGDLINDVLGYKPESFEIYDDNTLKLAVRFWPEMIKKMKGNAILLALRFLPEMMMLLTGGIPKLVLIAELTGDDDEAVLKSVSDLKKEIDAKFKIKSRIAKNLVDAEKYWIIRRESFNLLRKHVHGKKTAPFIDDVIVKPRQLPEFLPRLNAILEPYKNIVYTIAGHAGDANFHIIPLMDFSNEQNRLSISEIAEKVYNLVIEFGGSITAEHNDGLIRTPYLEKMFSPEVIKLFEETKKIFDPQNIFNPRKKVGGDMQFAINHIKIDK